MVAHDGGLFELFGVAKLTHYGICLFDAAVVAYTAEPPRWGEGGIDGELGEELFYLLRLLVCSLFGGTGVVTCIDLYAVTLRLEYALYTIGRGGEGGIAGMGANQGCYPCILVDGHLALSWHVALQAFQDGVLCCSG